MNSPCIHRTQRGSRYDPLGPGRLELPLLLLLLLLSVIWSIHNHSAPLRNCVVYGLIVGLYQLTSQFKFPIPPCLPSFLAFQSLSNSDWRLFLDSYYWCFVISCSSEPYSKSSWSFFLESTFLFFFLSSITCARTSTPGWVIDSMSSDMIPVTSLSIKISSFLPY